MTFSDITIGQKEGGEELLTYGEAAIELSLTKRTIQRYVSFGWIPVIRITARTRRIRRLELQRFLELAAAGELPPASKQTMLEKME